MIEQSLEQKAEQIINDNLKNVELISYFCKSSAKTPIFLGVIQKNYAEIQPLLNNGLVQDLKPIKSYIFNIEKLEDFFYELYQGKIDFLKDEIWRRKRKKNDIIEKTEELEPEDGCEDYDQRLREVLEFAKKAVGELDTMEIEKEDYNHEVGGLQKKMQNDPYYKFLLFIRNDKDFIFNKRVEDNQDLVRRKLVSYLKECNILITKFKKTGFYREYSPAKNYYITELGLKVDSKLKQIKSNLDVIDYQRTPEEIAQEEEYNLLKEQFGF